MRVGSTPLTFITVHYIYYTGPPAIEHACRGFPAVSGDSAGTERFVSPKEVLVGRDVVDEVGDRLDSRGSRALVLATPGVFDRYGERLLESLSAAGLTVSVYDEVRPDPTVGNVEVAADRYRAEGCDCLVTLGGGSAIDAGKAVGVVAANGGSIREYAVDRAGYEGVPEPIPPLAAVNTTAGTGSEATRSIVVSDPETATKFLVVSTDVVPTVAFEDPTLVRTLPASHTAFTGIDALAHAVEAYVSRHAWELSDTFARSAIDRIARWLSVSWADGDHLEARKGMLVGQLQAGQAFTNASVALVHGMARPLGVQLHVPHGLANGVLLPHVVDYSVPGAPGRYADVARLLGAADEGDSDLRAAKAVAPAIRDLCETVSLFGYLDEYADVPPREQYLEAVPGMAADAVASGSPANNPRTPDQAAIEDLYVDVYDDVLSPHADTEARQQAVR
jgi:alcohol dehydrogenase class IV